MSKRRQPPSAFSTSVASTSQEKGSKALAASDGLRNISTSAHRVLYLLLLLVEHRSLTLLELNFLLLEHKHIQRTYNNETITKYINTLRAAGCDIPPANRGKGFQYTLNQNPLPYALPAVCLKLMVQMLQVVHLIPDKQLHNKLIALTELVLWGLLPDEQKAMLQQALLGFCQQVRHLPIKKLTQAKPGCYSQEEMEAFCQCGQQLQIEYSIHSLGATNPQQQTLTIEAQRLIRQGSKLFLQCVETTVQSRLLLSVERIQQVQTLPSRVSHKLQVLTVIFQLQGRLSKTYRPYPNEELLTSTDSKTLLVRTECESPYLLAQRLLRYGGLCQVISPVSLQRFMFQKTSEKLYCLSQPNALQALFNGLHKEPSGEEQDRLVV
jgi:hypothetical protein